MTIRNAATGSQADMNAALALCVPGDTLIVPAGTFDVVGPINAFDGITIQGAGIGVTTLIGHTTVDWQPIMFIDAAKNGGQPFEMSGITFQGQLDAWQGTNRTSNLTTNSDIGVAVQGAGRNIRIHDCRFTKFNHSGLTIYSIWGTVHGDARGVVYNCQFVDNWELNRGYGIEIIGDPANWATYSAALSLMGTSNCFYIEDNTFQLCRHMVASNNGAIYVARHNTCTDDYPNAAFFDMHGLTTSWPRGARWRELYDNSLSNPDVPTTFAGIDARGGGGIITRNTMSGVTFGISLSLEQPIPVGQGYPQQDQIGNPDLQYIYGNTSSGTMIGLVPTTGGIQPISFWLQEGRDYVQTAPPGYVPLAYPHPLRAITAWQGSAGLSSAGVIAGGAMLVASVTAALAGGGAITCDALPLALSSAPVQIGQGSNLPSGASFGPSSTQGGATLVVIAGVAALGAKINGVSDSANGAYTQAGQTPQLAGRPAVAVFYKTGAAALIAGTDAITVTTSAGNYSASAIALPAGSTFDAVQSTLATARNSLPLALPGAVQPIEVLIGATMLDVASGAWTEDASFTANTNPGGSLLHSGYRNVVSLPSGAAQWLTQSVHRISSLDTGRLATIVAWGGEEFGYAYTYTLSGAPAGVTIDIDSGMLSVAIPLAGNTVFNVIATNRENGKSASFPLTLNVIQGVTQNWVAGQILHKTYDPHNSGVYGSPSGTDWTNVLLAIQSAIIADQGAVGDDNLRATIPFHRGATYQYTNNHWLGGIQNYDVTATGVGAAPILQNNGGGTSYEGGPLNIGNSGAMNRGGFRKSQSALINTVAAGATTVRLTTPSQVSRLIVGRWHQVIGSMIQIAGEPPNLMFTDWVKVLSVNAATGDVVLDRRLKYDYDSTWWEVASDDISFGRAWIYPADTDSDGRMTLRGRFFNINFQPNPNGSNIMLLQSHIESHFDACTIQNYQVTLGKHYSVLNGSVIQASSEPDKLSESLVIDASTTSDIGGATGYSYLLLRNSTFNGGVQISPRQMRSIGSTFSAGASSFPPYTFSYNGPNWYVHFKSTIFTGSVNNSWTFFGNPDSPITIGTNAIWNGNQLRISASYASFQDWLIDAYTGGIVAVSGTGPITANWGYIESVTSDGAGGAIWLNIVWVNGTKPLSGTVDIVAARMRRLFMESSCSFTGAMNYTDARFAKQQASPFEADWDFPAGYPKSVPALAPRYAPSWATAGNAAALLASFTSSGGPTIPLASATLAGIGSMTASAQLRFSASAALGSIGVLTPPAQMIASARTALAGGGAASALAFLVAQATATPAASSSLACDAVILPQGVQIATARLQGTSSLGAAAAAQPPPNFTAPLLLIGMAQFTTDPGTPFDSGAFFTPLSEGRSFPFADVNYANQVTPAFISWSPNWPTLANATARVLTFTLSIYQQASAGLVGQGGLAAAAFLAPISSAAVLGGGALVCNALHLCPAVATLLGLGAVAGDATQVVHATPTAAASLAGNSNLTASATAITSSPVAQAGGGALTARAIMRALASSSISGAGSISADLGLVHFSPAAQLFGDSQLIAGATQIIYNAGRAQLDGVCALSVDPVVFLGNALYVRGEGFLNAAAVVAARASATCGGLAVLVAGTIPLRATAAALSGVGVLGAGAAGSRIALARIDGLGSALVPAALRAAATASLFAFGDVHLTTSKQLNASALASGFGNMFIGTGPLVLRAASAIAVGSGVARAAASQREAATTSLAGTSGLLADGFVGKTFQAAAALSGAGVVACDAQRAIFGIAVLAGVGITGTILGQMGVLVSARATLAGQGRVASNSFAGISVAAQLNGQGTVRASINWLRTGQVSEMDGIGMLAASAQQRAVARAALAGQGTVHVAATYFISASLAGAGVIAVQSDHDSRLAMVLIGDGEFDGAAQSGFIVYHANAVPSDQALVTVIAQDYPIAA